MPSLTQLTSQIPSQTLRIINNENQLVVYPQNHKILPPDFPTFLRQALFQNNMNIEYYENINDQYVCTRIANPSSYSDFSEFIGTFVVCSISLERQTTVKKVIEHKLEKNPGTKVFISAYDPLIKTIWCCDFIDDIIFSNLFGLLTELNVGRIIYNDLRLQKIVLNTGLDSTYMDRNMSSLDILCKFLRKNKNDLSFADEQTHSLDHGSCQPVKFTGLLANQNLESLKHDKILVRPYIMNTFAKLPFNVLSSLHLDDNFLQILDLQTTSGKNMFKQFIKQPLIDIDTIIQRQNMGAFLYYCRNLDLILKRLNNIEKYSCRLLRLSVNDFILLCEILRTCNDLVLCLQTGLDTFSKNYKEQFSQQSSLLIAETENLFRAHPSHNQPLSNNDSGMVNQHLGSYDREEYLFRDNKQNAAHSTNNLKNHKKLQLLASNIRERIYYVDDYNKCVKSISDLAESDLIGPLSSLIPQFDHIIHTTMNTIDFDESEIKTTNNELNAKKQEILSEINNELLFMQDLNKKIKVEKKQNVFLFKISKLEYKQILRSKKVVEKSVTKSCVFFSTKRLEELNNELLFVENQISAENKVILDSLRVFINDFEGAIIAYGYLVALIDVLYSFGRLRDKGFTLPYFFKPAIHGSISAETQGTIYCHADKVADGVLESSNQNPQKPLIKIDNKSEDSIGLTIKNTNGEEYHTDDSEFIKIHRFENENFKYKSVDTPNVEKDLLIENERYSSVSEREYSNECLSILIKDCFHPLVPNCIPNSLILGKKRFVVITGPNMGGKSTYLKKVGINCILGQIGCLVPSALSILPIFKSVSIRIGANDNISSGLSTFMVEMTDIAHIISNLDFKNSYTGANLNEPGCSTQELKNEDSKKLTHTQTNQHSEMCGNLDMNEKCQKKIHDGTGDNQAPRRASQIKNTLPNLVLIDELGRGTNSIDGLALAKSVRDFIIGTNTVCLFATHFNELCSDEVVNKRAEMQVGDDCVLLYKIVDGMCITSYGIQVAKKVGFCDSVIQEAMALLENYKE